MEQNWQSFFALKDKFTIFMNIEEQDKKLFQSIVEWAGDMMELCIKERIVARKFFPKRGEVWTCNLGVNIGSELNKIRPVIVISNDIGNENSSLVTVVPISNREERLPTHVALTQEDFKYIENHIAGTSMAEQIKAVSKARLGRKIGELHENTLKRIEQSVLLALGVSMDVKNECLS
jgi:mRNA interferase MazF